MKPSLLSRLALPALFALLVLSPAQGQDRVELQAGGGYVFGTGLDDNAPSLPVFDLAAVLWFSPEWGIAGRYVRGYRSEEQATGVPGGLLREDEQLRYFTLTLRHRLPLADDLELNLGGGFMLGGRSESSSERTAPSQEPVRETNTASFNGFSAEALLGRPLTRHVLLKGGLTWDFNPDVSNLQPVGMLVISF